MKSGNHSFGSVRAADKTHTLLKYGQREIKVGQKANEVGACVGQNQRKGNRRPRSRSNGAVRS